MLELIELDLTRPVLVNRAHHLFHLLAPGLVPEGLLSKGMVAGVARAHNARALNVARAEDGAGRRGGHA